MPHYRVGACRLSCDVALETLVEADEPLAVNLRIEPLDAPLAEPREHVFAVGHRDAVERAFLDVSRAHDGYALTLAGVGTFLVSRGFVRYTLFDGTSPLALEQALVDQVVPRALHLFGAPSLHASAAFREDVGAVAFTGDSGAGKSTFCAAFARGGRIVSDDSLSLHVTATAIVALPGYPSLRLWPDAAARYSAEPHALKLATPRIPKLRLPTPVVDAPVPLAGVVLLERSEDSATTLDDLHGHAAFVALERQVHRLAPDDPGALAAEFALLTAVASRVPVVRLRYRPDLGALERLLTEMTARLRRAASARAVR